MKFASYRLFSFLLKFALIAMLRFSGIRKIISSFFSAKVYSGHISRHLSKEFQAILVTAISESQNPQLCKVLCNNYLSSGDNCWFTVPNSAITPHTLSSLSYCVAYSGKKWIIQCKTLDKVGADSLLKYLRCDEYSNRTDSSIIAFDFSCSQKQTDGLIQVVQNQKALQWIILSFCKLVDNRFIVKLCKAMENNSSVKMLHLFGCNITSNGVKAIARMLQLNSTLQWIGLRENVTTLIVPDLVLLLKTIDRYNDTLYMLILDNEFTQHLKFMNV